MTTRPKRPSEVDGVHYHFIDASTFETMRDRGELLESAKVHGNYYGTPAAAVEQALAEGRDVLFDIDWQGTQQIYRKKRPDIVSVFVLPPSATRAASRGWSGAPRTAPRSIAASAAERPHRDRPLDGI